jgi:hypothetical protein
MSSKQSFKWQAAAVLLSMVLHQKQSLYELSMRASAANLQLQQECTNCFAVCVSVHMYSDCTQTENKQYMQQCI